MVKDGVVGVLLCVEWMAAQGRLCHLQVKVEYSLCG